MSAWAEVSMGGGGASSWYTALTKCRWVACFSCLLFFTTCSSICSNTPSNAESAEHLIPCDTCSLMVNCFTALFVSISNVSLKDAALMREERRGRRRGSEYGGDRQQTQCARQTFKQKNAGDRNRTLLKMHKR